MAVVLAVRFFFAIATSSCVIAEATLVPGSEACAELGFSEALKCPTCNRLREILPTGVERGADDAISLVTECESCCTKDVDNEFFAKAIFHVSQYSIESDQDIEDFVKRKAPAFKNLKIEKSFGSMHLQLIREGETSKTATTVVNVRGWKSDEIRDFLDLKIGKKVQA
eukprot:TRINITY_DN48648_c0_g1_i1.p3 TRINITY_DN48648_c0_g1~~TRINITY_DN48648_c0_g1_i1.p3  ORF type:complete len:168 (-),score=39.70 TRINITY_DN48648_c0_g1_i1:177-680(-)